MIVASRPRHGFTLIELAVTLVVVAVAAAVVFPRLWGGWMGEMRARGAATRLASFLMLARDHAALGRRDVVVVMDFDAREYWAADTAGEPIAAGGGLLARSRLPAGVTFASVETSEGEAWESGRAAVSFRQDGFSTGLLVQIAGEGDAAYGVKVDGLSGEVESVKGQASWND